jgi:AraC-like DNA-binding protein
MGSAEWTSQTASQPARVTAGIDLALALVQDDLGRDVALAVARYLVAFLKRPGGQAQFSAALSLQMAEDRFGMLHEWIAEHLTEDLSLRALARHAAMSERSFSRRYAEATGLTPARCRAVQSGSRSAIAFRFAIARQTDCAALRLRVRGDDAAQLSALAVNHTAGLSSAVQLLRG